VTVRVRAFSRLLAFTAATLVTVLAVPAAGQDYERPSAAPQADPRAGGATRKMSTYEVDERTAKRLQAALIAVSEEDWDEAERQLKRLRPRSLNPLERQKASEIRAFVAFGRGDNEAARQHFEDAIAEGEMTDEERAQTRYRIMQLYLADQMWPQVIEQLHRWFEIAPDPSPAAYYVLALAYYQNDDLDGALEPAQQACSLSEAPEESWLQLLLAIHLTKKDYEAAIPVLEELVVRFPKKRYWLNLSTVYGALGNYEEALVPLQLAYTQGALTEDTELRRLAQLLLFLGLPYRAAEVIETELQNENIEEDAEIYEILGNSWIAAREYDKTVEPLTKAAELSGDGDLYVRLAQVQIQREKWVAASIALGRALELGELKKPGEAKLLMGIANYNSERPQQARTWFTRARSHEESRREADQWLLHLDREQQQSG
jgi:tetratricopeptide (TPR) repeat protein